MNIKFILFKDQKDDKRFPRPGQFSPSEVWIDMREKRELALRERFLRGAERWSQNTLELKPLLIQNQHGAGKMAKKLDRIGQVVESELMSAAECLNETDFSDKSHLSPHHGQVNRLVQVFMTWFSAPAPSHRALHTGPRPSHRGRSATARGRPRASA